MNREDNSDGLEVPWDHNEASTINNNFPLSLPECDLTNLHALTTRAEKQTFVGNAIYYPIRDALGEEMAAKITGVLIEGVVEIERLVKDSHFFYENA
jgi:hypothetical protein